jgi:hypothetical protein
MGPPGWHDAPVSRHAAPRGRSAPGPGVRAGAARVEGPAEVVAVGAPVRVLAAGIAAVIGVGLAGAALAGRPGVLAAVALVQALLVPAWVLGLARPGRIGGILLGLAAAAAADIALLADDRTTPAVLLGVLGLALPACYVHQLTRGVVRVRVTESLAGVATGVTAAVALSTLLALSRAADGPRLVAAVALAAGAGLAAARLTDLVVPVPRIAAGLPYGLPALIVAPAAGAVAAALTAGGGLSAPSAAALGGLVALPAALVSVGVGFAAAGVPEARTAAVAYLHAALPVALVAPVGYLVALSVAG